MAEREDNQDQRISRREFFSKLVTASAAAGVTLGAGAYFLNRHVIPAGKAAGPVRPFRVPGTEGVFAVARGADGRAITRRAVELAGGMGRFVGRGEKVLIKVNCAFARSPWVGATSSPEVVREVVRLCYEAGAGEVAVTDYPVSDARTSFTRAELFEPVEQAGGRVWLPAPSDFRPVRVNDGTIGTWEMFDEPLRWCDKLIGVPTVKSHNLSLASLAMKNWYGFFGGSRSRFHQQIHPVIVELGRFITPTLVVLDGTRKLMRNGPTGGSADDVVPGETVAVSTDQVAIDAFGAEMLELKPADVPFIPLAQQREVGTMDYRALPRFVEAAV